MKSVGQAAFEKFNELVVTDINIPWAQVPPDGRVHWEAIGNAAIEIAKKKAQKKGRDSCNPEWCACPICH